MNKYKVGDKVRIKDKAWIEQEMNNEEHIVIDKLFIKDMPLYAGRMARIVEIRGDHYCLDLTGYNWQWNEWMLEDPAKPDILSPEGAARAMLDREVLLCPQEFGEPRCLAKWDGENFVCYWEGKEWQGTTSLPNLRLLRHIPVKRFLTRWEILAWANSELSRGWVVRWAGLPVNNNSWDSPHRFSYKDDDIPQYQRARLLPDCSGIDETTIQGFEVDE
jgi:hypothetical protein